MMVRSNGHDAASRIGNQDCFGLAAPRRYMSAD
jgi:hypothetical protein